MDNQYLFQGFAQYMLMFVDTDSCLLVGARANSYGVS